MKRVNVLDNTLRDGSYAVDFSFTAADTARICTELERVGVRYIEVGHGLGLGATAKGCFPAAASDEEYLRAARSALASARFGMFCIPSIARLDDIDRAADHGMDFIRIGTDVTAVAEMCRYVERAKRRGLLTTANLMKSYAVPAERFAEAGALAASFGADVVYLVDSAGCMFPEDVRAYLNALRERSQVPFGFHGHDNLGMAVYNSVFSAEQGAGFVDGSLQGLGRRPGNAATELLVAALEKRGYDTEIDVLRLLRAGEESTRPLLGPPGIEALDVVAGYAGFHSGFLPKILAAAEEYAVDPALLIVELCEIDRCEVRDEDLRCVAIHVRERGEPARPSLSPRRSSATAGSAPRSGRGALARLLAPRAPRPGVPHATSGPGPFTRRAHRIGTEAAFGLGECVAEVESRGERVIRCNLGQPDYPLPAHIAEALKRAIDGGLTTYCDPQGIPELRRAVARSVGERRGLDIDPDRVVVYPGHRPAIGFAHLAYAEAGREVVYPSPGYPLYESFIPYFRSTPVPAVLREEDEFGLTREVLEPLLGARTALVFLNFPSNPTGSVATRAQLEEVAGLILERTGPNVRVFSDEAYEAITFDGHEHVSIASVPGMESRTIISSGCSKTFGWTGGRVGWAVYPTVREARMHRRLAINHFASISPYNQWAAVEALTSPLSAPAIDEMVRGFRRRRDLVVAGLNATGEIRCHMPRGAFYVFPNVAGALERLGAREAHARLPEEVRRDSSPATLFQLFLLHGYRVATMDRRSFSLLGSEGQHYLRISTATSEGDLEEAVRRMAAAAADTAGFERFVASGVKLTL